MQLSALVFSLAAVLPAALALSTTARGVSGSEAIAYYASYYGDANNSVDRTACAAEFRKNGACTLGEATHGYPFRVAVSGLGSLTPAEAGCGRCLRFEYEDRYLYAVAVDASDEDGSTREVDLSLDAFTFLGGDEGVRVGHIFLNVTGGRVEEQHFCEGTEGTTGVYESDSPVTKRSPKWSSA